jgi:hypothetical protein
MLTGKALHLERSNHNVELEVPGESHPLLEEGRQLGEVILLLGGWLLRNLVALSALNKQRC